ncbi:hypothetical protein FRC01_003918 [Tulasnella sp. 417]|nr:hypothetical protein FRC01_003918 [Tulasnella sp. 417]
MRRTLLNVALKVADPDYRNSSDDDDVGPIPLPVPKHVADSGAAQLPRSLPSMQSVSTAIARELRILLDSSDDDDSDNDNSNDHDGDDDVVPIQRNTPQTTAQLLPGPLPVPGVDQGSDFPQQPPLGELQSSDTARRPVPLPPIHAALSLTSSIPASSLTAPENFLGGLDHLSIDISRLKEETGYEEKTGEFTRVRACMLDSGTPKSKLVAAKTIYLDRQCKEPQKLAARLASELKVWAVLQHPHVLPLLGYYLDQQYITAVLISEYQVHGDLKDYIDREKPTSDKRLQLLRDSTDGLAYLHGRSPPIRHGDINMGSFLINAKQQAMLADSGLAKSMESGPTGLATSKGLKGTVRYYSPELTEDEEVGLPSDIWALGCLALEVLTSTIPYAEAMTEKGVIFAIVKGQRPCPVDQISIASPAVKRLLTDCWTHDPNERPSAISCLHILNSETSALQSNPAAPAQSAATAIGLTPLEGCLRDLDHLFIDISRLEEETEYEEKRGGFGYVRVCTLDSGTSKSKLVAVKTIYLKAQCNDPQRIAVRLARELKVWAVLEHSHVLPLLGFYLDKEYKMAVLISEYQVHGDLKDYIEQEKPNLEIRLQLIRDSTDGLAYLHGRSPPIQHGDLKPGNVLINAKREAMLADFGLSKSMEAGSTGLTTSKNLKGTLRYYSPELTEDHEVGLPSDIWALGCLALEVLTGRIPYADRKSEKGIIFAIVKGQPPCEVENLSIPILGVKRLLANCWSSDPNARPSASSCLHTLNVETSSSRGTRTRPPSLATRSTSSGYKAHRYQSVNSSALHRRESGSDVSSFSPTPPTGSPANTTPLIATPPAIPNPTPHLSYARRMEEVVNLSPAWTPVKVAPREPVDKLIITVTPDAETHFIVDITGAPDAAFIRKRMFSKLRIPDDDHENYQIYRTDLGEAALGDPVTDDQLMIYCGAWADAKGTLRFLIQHAPTAPPPQLQFVAPTTAAMEREQAFEAQERYREAKQQEYDSQYRKFRAERDRQTRKQQQVYSGDGPAPSGHKAHRSESVDSSAPHGWVLVNEVFTPPTSATGPGRYGTSERTPSYGRSNTTSGVSDWVGSPPSESVRMSPATATTTSASRPYPHATNTSYTAATPTLARAHPPLLNQFYSPTVSATYNPPPASYVPPRQSTPPSMKPKANRVPFSQVHMPVMLTAKATQISMRPARVSSVQRPHQQDAGEGGQPNGEDEEEEHYYSNDSNEEDERFRNTSFAPSAIATPPAIKTSGLLVNDQSSSMPTPSTAAINLPISRENSPSPSPASGLTLTSAINPRASFRRDTWAFRPIQEDA